MNDIVKKGETQGQQSYMDHGPAQRLNMHSVSVLGDRLRRIDREHLRPSQDQGVRFGQL
jgi:hypothetical protein